MEGKSQFFFHLLVEACVRINGGHTATLYRVEEYVKATREFLNNL